MKAFVSVLFVAMIAGVSCAKKSSPSTDDSAAGGGGGGTTPQAIASLWTVQNGAWTIDWSAGNTNGTPFMFDIAIPAGTADKCTCGVTLNGNESSGTCTISTPCTASSGTPAVTCTNNGGNPLSICGTGGYTNDGTYMEFTSGATYR